MSMQIWGPHQNPCRCVMITRDDIKLSLVDEHLAKSISKHPVQSAFHRLAMAKEESGIAGATPLETLHVLYVGIFQMTMV